LLLTVVLKLKGREKAERKLKLCSCLVFVFNEVNNYFDSSDKKMMEVEI